VRSICCRISRIGFERRLPAQPVDAVGHFLEIAADNAVPLIVRQPIRKLIHALLPTGQLLQDVFQTVGQEPGAAALDDALDLLAIVGGAPAILVGRPAAFFGGWIERLDGGRAASGAARTGALLAVVPVVLVDCLGAVQASVEAGASTFCC